MAEVKDILNIRLHVYDTDFPIQVSAADEPFYRNAARLITETVNAYSEKYKPYKSEKEVLYMAMIDIALQFEMQKGKNDTTPYDNILTKITTEIEEALDLKPTANS